MSEKPEKIVFYTSENEPVEFYVVEQTRVNDVNYILVTESMDEEAEAYIFKESKNSEDSEDVIYCDIEDENELEAIYKVFAAILDDIDIEF